MNLNSKQLHHGCNARYFFLGDFQVYKQGYILINKNVKT